MANYRYLVRTEEGKDRKGEIRADNERQARQKLRDQGLFLLKLVLIDAESQDSLSIQSQLTKADSTEKKSNRFGGALNAGLFNKFQLGTKQTDNALFTQSNESVTTFWGNLLKPRAKKVKSSDLALFTRQFATMVSSGLPLEEALRAVSEQSEKAHITESILFVRNKLLEGFSLAKSMSNRPNMFDKLYCAMVEAGEASGHLAPILNRLADYTEQRQKMKSQITQALVYPVLLTSVAICVIALLISFVVPKVVEQFIHMKQSLPLSTQILIVISDFVRHWGIVIVTVVLLSVVIQSRRLKRAENRLRFDERVLTFPVIGRLTKAVNTARYARTLSILHSSGVPLISAMKISANVLTNLAIKTAFLDASERVREGTSIYQSFADTKLLSPMMLYMVAAGEKSGELDAMLERSAENQDQTLSAQITFALSVFEPMLIITMAGIVLFIVLAIMQPIIAMNSMLG